VDSFEGFFSEVVGSALKIEEEEEKKRKEKCQLIWKDKAFDF
jgi:hypothetical protein